MFSENLGAIIGARWRKIITVSNARRNQVPDASQDNTVQAIHLEGPAHKIHEIKQQISSWYGSLTNQFLDGTKMRIIPPYQTVISSADKKKYGAVIARQAAFLSRLATGTTWEFATNLTLGRPHPKTFKTL